MFSSRHPNRYDLSKLNKAFSLWILILAVYSVPKGMGFYMIPLAGGESAGLVDATGPGISVSRRKYRLDRSRHVCSLRHYCIRYTSMETQYKPCIACAYCVFGGSGLVILGCRTWQNGKQYVSLLEDRSSLGIYCLLCGLYGHERR